MQYRTIGIPREVDFPDPHCNECLLRTEYSEYFTLLGYPVGYLQLTSPFLPLLIKHTRSTRDSTDVPKSEGLSFSLLVMFIFVPQNSLFSCNIYIKRLKKYSNIYASLKLNDSCRPKYCWRKAYMPILSSFGPRFCNNFHQT
jgi:hypothetical protein